ncbi:hypothetical protein [Asanoa ishikariensis]|nr:hypothetical protein [Asanoa ishikariensis]
MPRLAGTTVLARTLRGLGTEAPSATGAHPVKQHPGTAKVLLYWLPLGAGGHVVRWNGRLFEALMARRERRTVQDLYHSALEVHVADDRFVVEMTPAWGPKATDRGVVREGPVGSRRLGRFAAFRYEVRRWHTGVIANMAEAVDSPVSVGHDLAQALLLLRLAPSVPALTWGRDERHTGDMWNSNSLAAWLLVRSGHDTSRLVPPARGRAPGWHAGLAVAARAEDQVPAVDEPQTVQLARGRRAQSPGVATEAGGAYDGSGPAAAAKCDGGHTLRTPYK